MTDTQPDIVPIGVHIIKDDTKRVSRPKECRISSRTINLTATLPVQQLCGIDPARKEVRLNVIGANVVLAHSTGQANDANNIAVGQASPNGRLLQAGNVVYVIPGGANEIWFASAAPAQIGCTIVREI